VGPPGLSPSDW